MSDKKSIKSLADAAGVDVQLVYNRMNRGWTLDKALKTPKMNRGRKSKPKAPEEVKKQVTAKKVELTDTERKALRDAYMSDLNQQEQPLVSPEKESSAWGAAIALIGAIALMAYILISEGFIGP